MHYELFSLFGLTLLGSLIGNLRFITLTKEDSYQKYFITLIDSIVYGFLIGKLSANRDFTSIVFYTLGKLVALFLTDLFLKNFSNTTYVANLYLKDENSNKIQEYFLKENLSFTRFTGDFVGESRTMFLVHLNRKQKKNLLDELKKLGVQNPNIDIREVQVYGKIKERTRGE